MDPYTTSLEKVIKKYYTDWNVRAFLQSDLDLIHDWQLKRKMPLSGLYDLPMLGVVVMDNEVPYAIGFLRKCEGKVGMIDSVITNPDLSITKRGRAVDYIFKTLIAVANNNGIKKVIGFSTYKGMIKRVKKYNFKELDCKLMTLQLGE